MVWPTGTKAQKTRVYRFKKKRNGKIPIRLDKSIKMHIDLNSRVLQFGI